MWRHWGNGHTMTGAELDVMQPQAQDTQGCQQPPEPGRGRKDSSLEASEEVDPADTLISDF